MYFTSCLCIIAIVYSVGKLNLLTIMGNATLTTCVFTLLHLPVGANLWAGVWPLVWMWPVWVVQVDMNDTTVILIIIVYIRSTYMCLI